MRIYSEVTNSNPISQVNNRYCQFLLEDMYLPYLEKKGFLTVKGIQEIRDLSKASTGVHEIENSKNNFELVERVFGRFCDYLAQTIEDQKWTFDNLIAILWRGQPYSEHLRFETNLLKNISNRILMYYLNTVSSKFRPSEEYSEADVNLYRDLLVKTLTMADFSTDASSISWFTDVDRTRRSVFFNDSTLERIQQVLERPWREIQQTYLKILSELSEITAIHLRNLFPIPPGVLYFCFQQQILRYLPVAIDIIERSFSTTITELKMIPEKDSETGEEWLEFDIRIKGEIEEVLDNYDKYTDLLVSSLPWSVRYKMRLSYKIV